MEDQAYLEGFCGALQAVGCSESFVKRAAYELSQHKMQNMYGNGPLGFALSFAAPALTGQLPQLADLGDQLIERERAMKALKEQQELRRKMLLAHNR